VKLVVPYVDELLDLDARMIRLAKFLGIPYETVALTKICERGEFLSDALPDHCSCFAVNPEVMKRWVGLEGLSADLVKFLVSHFSNLLVYGVRTEDFDADLVAALSMGKLSSVDAVGEKSLCYEFAKSSSRVCEAFAGLSFGPANSNNDHVFCINSNDPSVESLISIGRHPFFAAVRLETTEILFLGGEDIADLDTEVGDAPLAEYFSRFLPYVMALRYLAGEDCWRPSKAHASIIIDDPLLRERYGFLDFESLLRLAEQHNFHTTIAFIPHNFRRNSTRITRMFQNNADRLSICFHGNDHTGREFASRDLPLLSTFVRVAEDRMNLHQEMTGLPCDRVMVFPQGNFSVEAMTVVKSHNFYAAVNRISHPAEQPIQLTIGDLAQPAVLRYGGFPLFGRKPIQQTESQDIAFNLFFGRPILIVEHHEIFQHPKLLVAIASKINSLAPEIHWSNLASVVSNSILTHRTSDGTHHVRAYSGTVRISNDSTCTRRYSVEWNNAWNIESIEQVLLDGVPCNCLEVDDTGLRVSVELTPASSKTFVLVHRSMPATAKNLGLGWKVRAFLRRRLSEIRDNYLSKNQRLLEAAKAFQRRFLKV
jgi:hypothetical protein